MAGRKAGQAISRHDRGPYRARAIVAARPRAKNPRRAPDLEALTYVAVAGWMGRDGRGITLTDADGKDTGRWGPWMIATSNRDPWRYAHVMCWPAGDYYDHDTETEDPREVISVRGFDGGKGEWYAVARTQPELRAILALTRKWLKV